MHFNKFPLECPPEENDLLICFDTFFFYMEIILAVTACERLILLNIDTKELRDYSILLYLCGFYEESLEFLKLYQDTKVGFLSLHEITIYVRSLTEQESSFEHCRILPCKTNPLIP